MVANSIVLAVVANSIDESDPRVNSRGGVQGLPPLLTRTGTVRAEKRPWWSRRSRGGAAIAAVAAAWLSSEFTRSPRVSVARARDDALAMRRVHGAARVVIGQSSMYSNVATLRYTIPFLKKNGIV